MAGIFDFLSTLNLTPRENTGLQTTRNQLPQGVLEGEYIPRDSTAPDSQARARIGVDPVSTQQQSGTNPDAKGRTFYGGRDGGLSTNPEDVRRQPSAASRWTPTGTHPETPAPRGSAWTPPAEARPVMADVAKGAGILSKFARVAGPVGFAYDTLNPQMLGDGELTREQQAEQARGAVENMGPQGAADAAQFGADVSKRTLDAGMNRSAPLDLSDPQAPKSNLFRQPPQETDPVVQQAEQPAVTPTQAGPAVEAAPVTREQAAATTAAQYETQRQEVENSVSQGLVTGEVSRPKAAEAVVQADAQRAGKTLTPDETKAAVAQELTSMKSMDNGQVSKYISYALLAGGLLASVMDKSGKTSEMFAQSFNKQLDRNLAAGTAQKKAESAAAKMAQDARFKEEDLKRDDRKISQTDTKMSQDLSLGTESNSIKRGGLALGYDRLEQTAADNAASRGIQAQGNNIQQQRLSQDQSQYEGLLQLKKDQLANTQADTTSQIQKRTDDTRSANERNLIEASKAAAAKDAAKGIDIATKDAGVLVKDVLDSAGRSVDKGAQAAIAQQVRVAAKNDPKGFAADPAGFVYKVVQGGGYSEKPKGFFTDPKVQIKQ